MFLVALLIIPIASAAGLDDATVTNTADISKSKSSLGLQDEIKKITHYAEEYETGNINYVKLMVHTAASRENINELMGGKELGMDGGMVVTASEIERVLGEPDSNGHGRWAWLQSEEREIKLDKPVPVWKKIVFDGKKIQIRFNAYPMAFKKSGEIKIFYNINVDAEFKSKEDERDFGDDVDEIEGLAKIFSENPSEGNGEKLARKSVEIERAFEQYAREGAGANKDCKDLMNQILGSESRMDTQTLLVKEATFYSDDMFEVILRLEMCEDCEWRWINMNSWIDGRVDFEEGSSTVNKRKYESLSDDDFKREIKSILDVYKRALEQGDMKTAMSVQKNLWVINEAWNEKANNVWDVVEKQIESERSLRSEEEMGNYDWEGENEKREKKVSELQENSFVLRKTFYENLFNQFDDVRDINYQELRYEKRLIEEFKLVGSEICDNGVDDNGDEEIDCGDGSCAGDPCGKSDVIVGEGNDSQIIVVDMYCIESTCQVREEDLVVPEAVCGDNNCELGEELTCFEDCQICPEYDAVPCEDGIVILGGLDENECVLPPVCIVQNNSCGDNSDCAQPLCGSASCVKGECKIGELELCTNPDCVDGEEEIEECENGDKIVTDICVAGLWESTGLMCEEDVEYYCEGNKLYLGEELILECGDEEGCDAENQECVAIECLGVVCESKCEDNVLYTTGHCDEDAGECAYDSVKECGENAECDARREMCLSEVCSYTDCNYEPQCGDSELFRFECEPESGECVKSVIETCAEDEFCSPKEDGCISSEEKPECGNDICERGKGESEVNCAVDCEEKGAGEECIVREDCGGEHDVCSNGWCVTLPEIV